MKTIVYATLFGLACSMTAGLPALAASTATCQETKTLDSNGNPISTIYAEKTSIMAGLRARGVDVVDIDDWGGCVKATVKQPDGSTVTQYFDPDSLAPLTTR